MAGTTATPAPNPGDDERVLGLNLAVLTKYGAVSAALAYATGMLTVNTFLHKLGITDFSFAKPKLILTGVCVLLTFLLLASVPVFAALRAAADLRSKAPRFRRVFFLLLLPLATLFLASALLCFKEHIGVGQVAVWGLRHDLGHAPREETLASLIIAGELYLPTLVAGVAAFIWAHFYEGTRSKGGIYQMLVLALATVAFVGYLSVFALTFYPAIPQAYGGGAPYSESFVIAGGARCSLWRLGIDFQKDPQNVTLPLPVLHASDTLVALWIRNARTKCRVVVVQLDKQLINGTMMEPWPAGTPAPDASCSETSSTVTPQTQDDTCNTTDVEGPRSTGNTPATSTTR